MQTDKLKALAEALETALNLLNYSDTSDVEKNGQWRIAAFITTTPMGTRW
jgi:hypothetical protein